jgi:RNA polymerase sigma-70 factor (ECF subfamily)
MTNTRRAATALHAGSIAPQFRPEVRATMIAAEAGSKALEQLLAQIAAARDQAAFAALYSATKGKLFSTVLLIVRRRDLAEDIIQDVYTRIWVNAHSYRASSGAPMSWMITIARNLAIDTMRRSVREIHADDAELQALPSDVPTPVETIEAAEDQRTVIEQQQKIFSALQALDPARRDLVIAAYIHGESREQLSKRAGAPVNTVKTWIRRALLEVQEILRNSENQAGTGLRGAARIDGPARMAPATPPRSARARTAAPRF